MTGGPLVTRRRLLLGAGSLAAIGVAGRIATLDSSTSPEATPKQECEPKRELVFGSSAATWQLSDPEYRRLFVREAEMLFTEDDLLWYRLRPKPNSGIDFKHADQIVNFAERHGMLVFGAHLVWDEGFGEGWTDDDLWGMDEQTARKVLFDTVEQTVKRYRGRVEAWSVVNEAIGTEGVRGLRTDVPWYETIGPSYVAESFHLAHDADPDALLVLNEFGYETINEFGDKPIDKQRATLEVVDRLLDDDVPVQALGVQAHLLADRFAERFHPAAYQDFLSQIADRDLKILITELDVLDDGLPADRTIRDRLVADAYRRYLDATLQQPAVGAVIAFGLSDRYTWLQEDYPREDGAPRRPLPFDEGLRPKPAYRALTESLKSAPARCPIWKTPETDGPTEAATG